MNVSFKPCDFKWGPSNNDEPLSLELEQHMLLFQIQEFLVREMCLAQQQLQITLVPDGIPLDQTLTLEQLQIQHNSELYLYADAPVICENAFLHVYVDDILQTNTYEICLNSTGLDLLTFFKDNAIFDQPYIDITIQNEFDTTSDLKVPLLQLGVARLSGIKLETKPDPKIDIYYDNKWIVVIEALYNTTIADINQTLIDANLIKAGFKVVLLKNADGLESTQDVNSQISAIGLFQKYCLEIYTNIIQRRIKYQWQWQEGTVFNDYDDEDINEQLDIGYEEFLKNNQLNKINYGTHVVNLKNTTVVDQTLQTAKSLRLQITPNGDQYLFDGKQIPADMNDLIINRIKAGSIEFEIFYKRHKVVFSKNEVKQINEESNFSQKVQFIPYTKAQKQVPVDVPQLNQNIKINIKKKYPIEWDPQTINLLKVDLPTNHAEFRLIKQLFLATNPKGRIHKIFRIQNKLLWDNYITEKKRLIKQHKLNNTELSQIETETYLWHGVKDQHPSIIYNGENEAFDATYCKDKCYWGSGIYFAEKSLFSRDYSYKLSPKDDAENAGKLVFLCCLVTTGKVHTCPKDSTLKRPPAGYDSISGTTDGSQVYILYLMDVRRAYPAYEIVYE